MSDDNYIETKQEDGSIDQVSLYDIVQFENEKPAENAQCWQLFLVFFIVESMVG